MPLRRLASLLVIASSLLLPHLARADISPSFVGSTTALTANKNSGAIDLRDLLHVSDITTGTMTWSQNSAPSHGTLTFTNATAATGTNNITPGGTITYTPAANFSGTDSFSVKATDSSSQTIARTITVTFLGQGTVGSQFVAVGQSGLVLTSPNGTTWTPRTSGTSARMRAAVASGNLLVAVGETGAIITSADGITWTPQTSGVSETLRGVAASPTRYVTVGGQTASLIRFSDDGVSWAAATTVPALGALRAVTWGNGQFVAVGASGAVLTSPNGQVWTQQNANSTERLDGAFWTGSNFTVFTSTGKVLTSSDAATWTSAQSTPPSWIEGLTWSDTQFIAVGGSGKIKTSPDATAWTWQTSGTTNTIHGITWTGTFVPQTLDPVALGANLRKITVSGVTASPKTYDGTTAAVINTTGAALVGVNAGDTVNLVSSGATGAFAARSAGADRTVNVSGFSITGANAADYTLVQPSPTATITAKALTVSGAAVSNKIYNATTAGTYSSTGALLTAEAAGTGSVGDGIPYTVDNVSLNATNASAAFSDALVSNSKSVTASGFALSGTDAANYTITQPTGLVANITPKALTVTGLAGGAKTYDGTTAASLTGTAALLATEAAGTGATNDGKPYSTDSVTLTGVPTGVFSAKDVGNNVGITISGLSVTGTGSGNYTVTQPTGASANITAKALTVTGLTASARTYDGTTVAPLSGTAALLATETAGTGTTSDGRPYGVDAVSVTGTPAGVFSAKDVVNNVGITVSGLSVTGTGSGNYTVTQPTGLAANITAKALTVTGVTASAKIYDGTTVASLGGVAALLSTEAAGTGTTADGKPYGVDAVSVTGTPSGTLAAKDVANNVAITITGLSVTGTGSGNYTVVQPTGLTANITAKVLTVAGVTASDKIYDGTTVAPLAGTAALLATEAAGTGTTADGKPYGIDAVTVAGTPVGAFAAKDVGGNVAITVTGLSVTGAGSGNYTVTQPAGLTANITPKALTVANVTASAKIYDGTTVAPLAGTAALLATEAAGAGSTSDGKPYSVDSVSVTGTPVGVFATRNVGNGVAVTVSGLTATGTGNGNYTVTQPLGLTANITAKALTVTGVAASNKIYDATAVAPLTGVPALLATEAAGTGSTADGKPYTVDSVSIAGTPSGLFSGANVGNTVAVTVSGLSVAGTGNGNYTITPPAGLVANITAKALTIVGLSSGSRIYDATPSAALTGTPTLLSTEAAGTGTSSDGKPYVGDTVAISGTPIGSFASKTVGTGKPVTVVGLSLTGAQAANYSATAPAGVTGSISAKTLTVVGVTVANKAYDGNTTANVNIAGAALVGVISGDTVSLSTTTGVSGTFATASVSAINPVAISGLGLAGLDAPNYSLTTPSASAAITPASAAVALTNLTQTYDGTAKSVTVTTVPANLATSVTYGGATTAPVNGGTYPVAAVILDPNYAGTGTGTLTIAKADQTLTFNPAGGAINAPLALTATATSGLGVTFSVVSGSATVSGSTLTLLDGNPVVVRATQAGNGNYNTATLDRTVAATSKLGQTITFNLPGAQPAVPASITLNATATSGLPVTFTLSGGPATLSGNTLTLTGAPGTVSLVASQAGNATYSAAAPVSASLNVSASGQIVFFGSTGSNDTVAANLNADGKTGTIIGFLAGTSQGYIVNFTLNPDGTFTATATTFGGTGSASATGPAERVTVDRLPEIAAAAIPLTFRGSYVNGALSGTITELNLPFTTTPQPPAGPTAGIAGYYLASSTNTASGATYSMVGTQGRAFVLVVTPTVLAAGSTTVAANNTFSLQTGQSATVAGAIDPATNTVSGSISVPGKPVDTFSGSNTAIARTDRLINLSSRARIAADGSGVLITGFVIGGTDPKRVLLRAVGPTLGTFGVQGALVDPKLQLFDSRGKLVTAIDDWSGSEVAAAASAVGAFPLVVGSKDAAVVITLQPGAYTMQVADGGGTGVALAEIYDASTTAPTGYQRLINISSRGIVGAGENALIGGFVVTGNTPKRVLVRGAGPALAAFGVTGVLADPTLKLYDSAGKVVAQNDNWETPTPVQATQSAATAADVVAANAAAGAFGFAAGSKDAALIITLAPGAYSAQVTGANNTAGSALVEIYELP